MLFGHNPDFTTLANTLTGQRVGHVPTCSIFCADFDVPSWSDVVPGAGEVVFFDYPKKQG